MRYSTFLIPIFCCFTLFCTAQEQLGLRTENYSGVNSILLNPASNLTGAFHWDLNLIAAGQFIDNNFAGFRDASLADLINIRNNSFLATDFPSDQQFPAGATILDFEAPGKEKFATAVTNIMGPSFLLNFEKHSFAIFTNFRVAGGGQQIPAVLGYYDYQQIIPPNDFSVAPSSAAGMAWSEVGFNYLFKTEISSGLIGFGINARYLRGFESFYIKNNTNLNINKASLDILTFQNGANIDFGFTSSSLDQEDVNLEPNGTGFGFDLGITYATFEYEDGYGLKLGLSLLDIGKIRFNKNTEAHAINITESFVLDPRTLEDVTGFRDAIAQLETELSPNLTTTLAGDTYDLWLPTALSLQADLGIRENLYVNATLIQRLPIGPIGVNRGNLFALTPRYESRWISAFLPISIYNWQHMKVGTALRLAFFSIGTEDMGSFFGKKNLTGTDFYAAIKFNPFKLGWKNGGGKGKEMKCYQF